MDTEVRPNRHLGHMILEAMKRQEHFLAQIDAATGEEQTYGTAMSKSIHLAKCLRSFGLKPGDILAISGENQLNVYIPLYAGLFNGQTIIGIDPCLEYVEIKILLQKIKPKFVFCQDSTYNDFVNASVELCLETEVLTFDDGDNSLANFQNKYDDGTPNDLFKVSDFDLDQIYAFLCTTSGTTGNFKIAAFKQKQLISKILAFFRQHNNNAYTSNNSHSMVMHLWPLNWISSIIVAVSTPFLGVCNVMTSNRNDLSLIVDMINKYKPVSTVINSPVANYLVSRKDDVDLTCFEVISMTGVKSVQEAKK